MENLFFWGLVLAGGLVGLLGSLLFASERELKARSQRLQEFESALGTSTGMNSAGSQEHNCVPELERQIAELTEKNRALEDETDNLRQKLEQDNEKVHQLVATQERLTVIEIRADELQRQNSELKENVSELQKRLYDSEMKPRQTKKARKQPIQGKLQHSGVGSDNSAPRTERQDSNRNLEESEEKIVEVKAAQTRLTQIEAESSEIKTYNDHLQQQIAELQGELAGSRKKIDRLEGTEDKSPETTLQEVTSHETHDRGKRDSAEPNSIEEARKFLREGQYQETISRLKTFLEEHPENREARLLHLLASIYYYNIYGYEKQIHSIKELSDLSDNEKIIARDIFLVAAREADNRGKTDEGQHFRALAAQVISPSSCVDSISTDSADNPSSVSTVATSNGSLSGDQDRASSNDGTTPWLPAAWLGRWRNDENSRAWQAAARIVVGVVLALVFAGTLASGFWGRSEKEGAEIRTIPPNAKAEHREPVENKPLKDNADNSAPIQTVQLEEAKENIDPVGQQTLTTPIEPTPAKSSASKSSAMKPSQQGAPIKPNSTTLASVASKRSALSASAAEGRHKSLAQAPTAREKLLLTWGKYEVIHPTKVYREPNEQAETVARINAGMKVNVVNIRDEWLEIRSRYGRPPGFIKKGSAVPLSAQ